MSASAAVVTYNCRTFAKALSRRARRYAFGLRLHVAVIFATFVPRLSTTSMV